jgi:hypothetical protein
MRPPSALLAALFPHPCGAALALPRPDALSPLSPNTRSGRIIPDDTGIPWPTTLANRGGAFGLRPYNSPGRAGTPTLAWPSLCPVPMP